MNFYSNFKKSLKENEWEDALRSGKVVTVSNKPKNYTPTDFKYDGNKVYYKNKHLSGNTWAEHPNSLDDILKHFDRQVSEEGSSIDIAEEKAGKHYPEGKILREPDMSRAGNNVRDWYVKEYPTDELGKEIPENLTFNDVFDALDRHQDIYELLAPADDSIVRERIFSELADVMGTDYDYVYNQWLGESNSVHKYKVVVKHDKGKATLTTTASSKEAAIKNICNMEKCPESAIVKVTDLGSVVKESAETDKIKKEIKEYKKVLKGDIPGIERDKYEAKLNNVKKKLKEMPIKESEDDEQEKTFFITKFDSDFDRNGEEVEILKSKNTKDGYRYDIKFLKDGKVVNNVYDNEIHKIHYYMEDGELEMYDDEGNYDEEDIRYELGDYADAIFKTIKKDAKNLKEAEKENVVKSLKDDKEGLGVDIVKAPNKKFFNYYYSSDKDHWDSSAGPFNSEKEAIKMAKKHRPTVKESQTQEIEAIVKDLEKTNPAIGKYLDEYLKEIEKDRPKVAYDKDKDQMNPEWEDWYRNTANVLYNEKAWDKFTKWVEKKYGNKINESVKQKVINSLKEAEGTEPTGILKAVLDKAEELGWTYDECDFAGNDVGYEFYQYSPAGEDFSITAECGNKDLSDDEKGRNLIINIGEVAENFDPDEHIEMWVEARANGVSGVPGTRALVEDADDIQKMLDDFAAGVKTIDTIHDSKPVNESEKKSAVSSWTFRD